MNFIRFLHKAYSLTCNTLRFCKRIEQFFVTNFAIIMKIVEISNGFSTEQSFMRN